MKYLKSFNENKINFIDNLKSFCDNHLAFLIDNGFIVRTHSKKNDYCIEIIKGWSDGRFISVTDFTWDEIKDDFIPFFEMLSNKYIIDDCNFRGDMETLNTREISISLNDILDDKVDDILIDEKNSINRHTSKNKKVENLLPKISSIKIIIKSEVFKKV